MLKNNEKPTLSINEFVDKVYVLSVKTFTKRIAHIKSEMHKHAIDFQFIFNHDIPEIDPKTLVQLFSTSCTLTMAQKSLVLKHIDAWRDAAFNNYKRVLIFEDDVVLNKDFYVYFKRIIESTNQLKAGYLVFLGGTDAKVPDHYLLSNETIVALPIATAEGYITDLTAIKRRLDWLQKNKTTLPADHLIRDIDKELNIANYWSRKSIVEQGSVTGIFGSELDSHRLKHSKLFNISRYHWNKFQRHYLRLWFAKFRQKFYP